MRSCKLVFPISYFYTCFGVWHQALQSSKWIQILNALYWKSGPKQPMQEENMCFWIFDWWIRTKMSMFLTFALWWISFRDVTGVGLNDLDIASYIYSRTYLLPACQIHLNIWLTYPKYFNQSFGIKSRVCLMRSCGTLNPAVDTGGETIFFMTGREQCWWGDWAAGVASFGQCTTVPDLFRPTSWSVIIHQFVAKIGRHEETRGLGNQQWKIHFQMWSATWI